MARDTDRDWEIWGSCDPYYGVLSDPQFRRAGLTEDSLESFFATGEAHLDRVMDTIRQRLRPDFSPRSILDYGCGVGRLVIPFAKRFERVIGVDVSLAMLEEAARNASRYNLQNVQFHSAEALNSLPSASIDLIHSFIVFQHIPVNRGQEILRKLLRVLKPGGIGAIHITFSRDASLVSRVATEIRKRSEIVHRLLNLVHRKPFPDPPMLMNAYPLSSIFSILISERCGSVYSEFSCHGDVRGAMLFFQKQESPRLW